MQQSPSWKANSFSSSQEILQILLNPKVECHLHNCLPLVTVMNHVYLYCKFLKCNFNSTCCYFVFVNIQMVEWKVQLVCNTLGQTKERTQLLHKQILYLLEYRARFFLKVGAYLCEMS